MKKTVGLKKKVPKEDDVKKELGPFDYINAVSFSKEDLIRNSEDRDLSEKAYNAFLTNKALSYHVSSIFDAQMMNETSHLDKLLQFDFLLNNVRREKRFSAWFKKESDEELDLIAMIYKCNLRHAKEFRSILTDEQVETLRYQYRTGGVTK